MPADIEHPETYDRRVLLAVTGLSPQIVTETLYALAIERKPAWIPTEIHIITTQRGAHSATLNLLSDNPGWFHRLRHDYQLPEIAFDAGNVHIITGPAGNQLDDIIDDADNGAVADFITEEVRRITADPMASLHVSIAGGRKTMGFHIGYALSLFGRAQDRLSHVLVEPPFESRPEFFYPAPSRRVIYDRDGQALDAGNARVYLGDIPFVRLRDGLPSRLLEGHARFSEAVAEAQKALAPLALHLDPSAQSVVAGGESVPLKPAQLAYYWMMAERCRAGRGGVHWTDRDICNEMLEYYGRLVNVHSGIYEKAEEAYREKMGKHEFKYIFDPPKTRINNALKLALGERRAQPYLIVALEEIAGTRYHRFGLSLSPEAITIAPASVPAAHVGAAATSDLSPLA